MVQKLSPYFQNFSRLTFAWFVSFAMNIDEISSKATFQQRKGSIWILPKWKKQHFNTGKYKLKLPEITLTLLPSVSVFILGRNWVSGTRSVRHLVGSIAYGLILTGSPRFPVNLV